MREDRFASDGNLRQPLIAIADSQNRTPKCAKVFLNSEVLSFAAEPGQRVDLSAMLRALAARGCNEVLVEAGGTLSGAFLGQGLWDEAIVYLAPKLLGQTARPMARIDIHHLADAIAARVASTDVLEDDIRVILRPLTNNP